MKVLVTGGTGTLGRLVVPRLRDAGGDIRVLSRHHPELTEGIEYVTGDLATGEGIDAAVSGTEIIVHCAGSAKRATRTRLGTWCVRRRGAELGIW